LGSDLLKRVSSSQISVLQKSDALSLLEPLPKFGRYTLRGPNGSGKTSLLLSLKEIYGDGAFYLPAQWELETGQDVSGISTGQRAVNSLLELLTPNERNGLLPILLLDEWDANLDEENQLMIDQRISEIAKTHLVIESRHHK
jgi:ABC-type bacteriocin/lantibiotic exporter with double-glycine peptidase domain